MPTYWLTTEEAAKRISKPRSWLDNNAANLNIPRVRIGRQFRYDSEALDTWMRSLAEVPAQ